MKALTRKMDQKARLTLPSDYASCLVTIGRRGDDELCVRKARKVVARRYLFRGLMARVTKKNLDAEIKSGQPVGKEVL